MRPAIHVVSASPTVDTSAYGSGDLIGAAALQFPIPRFRAEGCLLEYVQIIDQAKQSANVDLVLFGSDPSGTTFSDNAAFDIADADMAKIVALVSVTTHFAFSDNSASNARGLGIPIFLDPTAASQILYGALVARATPTFAAGTDVRVTLGLRAA